MAYVIEQDRGKDAPPAFWVGDTKTQLWGTRDDAKKFDTEEEAQELIAKLDMRDTITAPFDVEVFNNEK